MVLYIGGDGPKTVLKSGYYQLQADVLGPIGQTGSSQSFGWSGILGISTIIELVIFMNDCPVRSS